MSDHVFVRIHYSIIEEPGLFKALKDYIGFFQIQQTIEQAHREEMDLWFYTDKVKIEDGKTRQVDITAMKNAEGCIDFTMSTF